ncbi:hypothetical protein [Okeania sp. SIO2B3]|uniref:hypothetical protein n=1 Tax=Okeania sp. SIO2B3 TaxID=2607784 RepID=UPI0013C2819C|nr:hypothetical protein [Okeania sp. SIO2B3]NET42877.1 hypothetical protein [Okeania sp. SIO2B3]
MKFLQIILEFMILHGLEIKDIKKFKQKVFQKIKEQRKRKLEEHINCIWYCINEGTGRLEGEERKWIEELIKYKIRMIIVMTKQAYNDELFDYLKEQ